MNKWMHVAWLTLACSSESFSAAPLPAPDAGHEASRADAARTVAEPDASPQRTADAAPGATVDDAAPDVVPLETPDAAPVEPDPVVEPEPEPEPEQDAAPEPEPEPTLDPCDVPPTAAKIYDCDQVCGGTEIDCNACGGFLSTVDSYFVFGDGAPCGDECIWNSEGYGFGVPSGKCVRLTVQPGAHATFGRQSCDVEAQGDCAIVSSNVNGNVSARRAQMVGPDRPAWVRYESADLVLGDCPLQCP